MSTALTQTYKVQPYKGNLPAPCFMCQPNQAVDQAEVDQLVETTCCQYEDTGNEGVIKQHRTYHETCLKTWALKSKRVFKCIFCNRNIDSSNLLTWQERIKTFYQNPSNKRALALIANMFITTTGTMLNSFLEKNIKTSEIITTGMLSSITTTLLCAFNSKWAFDLISTDGDNMSKSMTSLTKAFAVILPTFSSFCTGAMLGLRALKTLTIEPNLYTKISSIVGGYLLIANLSHRMSSAN